MLRTPHAHHTAHVLVFHKLLYIDELLGHPYRLTILSTLLLSIVQRAKTTRKS